VRNLLLSSFVVALIGTGVGCSTIEQIMPDNPLGGSTVGKAARIAVLPFAYRGAGGVHACDLCPDTVVMARTSEDDALLVTAFFYEALTRHPRLQVVDFERIREVEGASMRDTLTRLAELEKLDAVIVGALLELRPRLGDPRDPEQRGGAAIYAALLDLPSGRLRWKRVYDRTPGRTGRAVRQYERLVVGEESKALSAYEVAQAGVERMVSSLARSMD
jgi:hypothetical protein